MSQPTPYTPTTDFSQQEANNASGRSTVNTAALDAEFAAIDTTLDQTLANIQLLQRDDGRLMDVSVEMHTLSPEVLNLIGGYNLRGAWLANTDYAVNDVVSHDTYMHACKTAHNSGATFSDTNWLIFGFSGSNDAAQAAAQAAVSANEAHISELAAAASASSASSSATTATTQAGLASSSATAADASADAALISETNAANSASAAASSASSISVPGGKAMVLKDSAGVSYVEGAAGTTAQRPGSPVVGHTRFNTTLNADETWSGSAWLVAGNVTQTGTETLTNKTLTSPVIEVIKVASTDAVSITTNGLQFTKNKLINGEVTRINQRVFNGTWSGKSVWETQPATIAGKEASYGYDMWFRSNAARLDGTGASENMAQWIEAGNFRPSTVHTLSGTGVTTTNITSPASGDWKIVVAQGATNVQVEEGTVATPFELRSIRYELAECQRYYEVLDINILGTNHVTAGYSGASWCFSTQKRITPSLAYGAGTSGTVYSVGTTGVTLTNLASNIPVIATGTASSAVI